MFHDEPRKGNRKDRDNQERHDYGTRALPPSHSDRNNRSDDNAVTDNAKQIDLS
jgi:hypothetical protein